MHRLYPSVYGHRRDSLDSIQYYVNHWLFPESIAGAHVLDIGGGDGAFALYLCLCRGAKTAVLDEYEGRGAEAENYSRAVRAKELLGAKDFHIYKGDVTTVDVPPEFEWDYVYLRNTLHHIYLRHDPEAPIINLFRRIHSWLRPGGHLRVGEVNWLNVWSTSPLGKRLFPRMDFSTKSTPHRWRKCAEKAGFAFEYIAWYVPRRLRKWRLVLANPIANAFLTGSYILSLHKKDS
jgi:SAM-dependent methyltransferase